MKANALLQKHKNPEAYADYMRAYRAENKDYYLATSANYRARKANAEGEHTAEEWAAVLDYFGHHCAYCLKHESEVGTLAREHMVPLARGGSNSIDNIVPSCKVCNSTKKDKTPLEFISYLCDREQILRCEAAE